MQRLYFRYFPMAALSIVLALVLIWSWIWWTQKPENIAKMEERWIKIGLSSPVEYELKGFPSRYDFVLDAGTLTLPFGRLSFGALSILTYPQQTDLAIINFESPLTLETKRGEYVLSAQDLKASIEFDAEQNPIRLILSAGEAVINAPGAKIDDDRLIIAYDASEAEHFGLRRSNQDVITAPSFEALEEEFLKPYLQ